MQTSRIRSPIHLIFILSHRRQRRLERFLRGLEEVAAYAPPGAARLQTAWLLLRVCGLGKATHLLRTLPCRS